MNSIVAFLLVLVSVLFGAGPAQANNTRTVDAHEYEQVSFHEGMSMARVHRIFDSRGALKTKPPIILYQERWYKNACHSSPVSITYIFKGRWEVYNWDAYYPHSYPDFSHACLYPHPND